MNTLQHVPLWVWGLLALLLALGLRQSQTQQVPRRRLVILSVAWTFYAVLSLGRLLEPSEQLAVGLLVWALCNTAASLQARPLFASALASDAHHLTVPGSWAPLALYLLMFGLRFAHGMFNALSPASAHAPATLLGLAAVTGLLSGLINARNLRLLQTPHL